MYLSELKIWNFRKYGLKHGNAIKNDNPGLNICFQNGLNLLVGENDSGKTGIIDAIKLILNTQSFDNIRIEESDFFKLPDKARVNEFKIECIFRGFTPQEAGNYLEWAGYEEVNGNQEFVLKVRMHVVRKDDGRIISDIKAGSDEEGIQLDGNARNLLRVTYLKPLRDADIELSAGYRSRLAQILRSHPVFKKQKDENGKSIEHKLEAILKGANANMEKYFSDDEGKEVMQNINEDNFKKFISKRKESATEKAEIGISGKELSEILKSLNLRIDDNKTGLGTQNLLFIATELILLQRHIGLKLCLIEEIEAHLHAQAQIRLIEFLRNKTDQQFILTTHSPNLASKVDFEKIIICKNNNAFPLTPTSTHLEKEDYLFLKRFLDVTKSNLFFSEGVLIVEGDAENILVPAIAEVIGRPLHEWGVSLISVGSKALLRYAKIFKRKDGKRMNLHVACVTDLDIRQTIKNGKVQSVKKLVATNERTKLEKFQSKKDNLLLFSSPLWTMEFDLALGELQQLMFEAIHVAQLVQSRMKNQNFSGLTDWEIAERRKEAIVKLDDWKKKFKDDNARIAYEIFKPLENKRASKAIASQYLASFLLKKEDVEKHKEILLKDKQVKYIISAIEHVTKKL